MSDMSLRFAVRRCRCLVLSGTAFAAGSGLASQVEAQKVAGAVAPVDRIDFTADRLTSEKDPDRVEAAGNVHAVRGTQRLRAESVLWDREAGLVTADGDIAIDDGGGNLLFGAHAVLDEQFENGTVTTPLVTMKDARRLAGSSAKRQGGVTTIERGNYTACHVVDAAGCPTDPFWTVTASQIIHDENTHRIRYKHPRLNMLGVPILWLPGLSNSDGSEEGTSSGLLVPNITYTASKGLEYAQPYYVKTSSDRDLLLTPHVYSGTAPMLEARYRRLTTRGVFSISGSVTRAPRLSTDVLGPKDDETRGASFRGALDARAHVQIDPYWSLDASVRVASDRGYLRRYDITGEDRLRSSATLERIDGDSYMSVAAYGFQILRFSDSIEGEAFAAPVVDYRRRIATRLPGVLELDLGGVSLFRDDGENVARLGSRLTWAATHIDQSGRIWGVTTLLKADGYNVTSADEGTPIEYRGRDGITGRGLGAAALDVRWALIAPLAGGMQTITPRLQLAASEVQNAGRGPNEESRTADFDDTALFALNPLPGQDRWLGGTRLTYGLDWRLDRPRWAVTATAGQIFFITCPVSDLPAGTGLSGGTSDVVAAATLRVDRDWRLLVHTRVDDKSAELRRLDVEGSWSTGPADVLVSYTKIDRGDAARIGADFPNYQDVALAMRLRFAKYWTATGGTVINLRQSGDEPLTFEDGFQPVRRRFGLSYDDECISIGVSWKREYDPTGNASGDNFKLRFSIKTLGR